MAVYAIGDIQGCFDELQALLEAIHFSPSHDHLWFAGDLVNRGPKSLETLRFIKGLGKRAVSVLGNHDLHLIAAAHGHPIASDDHTLDAILNAPDRDELINWLRQQPLLHHDAALGYTMIHAGLPPQWDLKLARQCAQEVETMLRSDNVVDFIEHMYGNKPCRWSDELSGWKRMRFTVNCLTRLRFCDGNGRLKLKYKGPPGSQPAEFHPWFELAERKSSDLNIVFGHWSTLGKRDDPGVFPLDTACLWGGELTALRLDTAPQWFSLSCAGEQAPA
ncbi:MAG: symmetrical bis(5'-nucleosyl)-tetraphosphatase [Gammaproteobacteria bacterium]|nr:symmetrical bis(5'-nucleosyl)-tetraphosphatase [Gammaproteobacteria bacterium]MDH3971477.1 symmetrical bis(5'-nucleosyl)-tetraphosphatase [Gammaproteobacteria bacterium]MDH3986843.1 symmetrical bis(5'-nucleosyl)-tetraphosphatase [Gammaproteobacteria bacterium]